jgi:hypothetical protein
MKRASVWKPFSFWLRAGAIAQLVRILEADRPELLEKIARALAEETGRPMPAKLRRVR